MVVDIIADGGVTLERQQITNHEIDFVILRELAHLRQRGFRLCFGILDNQIDWMPAKLVVMLVEIKFEALDHLLGALGHEPGKRYREPDFYRLGLGRCA